MEISVGYDMRSPEFGTPATRMYREAIEQVTWADEHGFDSVSLAEHHDSTDGYLPSPIVLGAAFAAATRRLRIKFSVLLAPLYDPLHLAEDLAVLDLISEGRLRVELGAGYRPSEYAMFGRDIRRRPSLMTEIVQTLKQAWTGEPFEYRGTQVRVLPRPAQQPRPAIVLGGASPAAARRAAELADGFDPMHPRLYEIYLERLHELGHPEPADHGARGRPGVAVHIARDPEKAWSVLAPFALHETNEYARWSVGVGRALHHPAADVDELRASGAYAILTPEQARERLAGEARVSLRPLLGGMPPEVGWESLELFTTEVLPSLRAAGTSADGTVIRAGEPA